MKNLRRLLRLTGLLVAAGGIAIAVLWATGTIDGLFTGVSCTDATNAEHHQCSAFENALGTSLTAFGLVLSGLVLWFFSTERFWAWVAKPARPPRVIDLSGGRSGPRAPR